MKLSFKIIIPVLVVILLIVGGLWFFVLRGNANEEAPALIETPPSVSKVNTLPLADRPYVELIPHANKSRCGGIDLKISNLKNDETEAEYELEYNTATMIQGVFGTRDLSDPNKEHQPLEFGTCSKGVCKCDDDITGGNLKLSFTAKEDYVLKADFSVQKPSEHDGVVSSLDGRLQIAFGDNLDEDTPVLITSTFGLPKQLSDKVVLGPYGIFIEDVDELEEPATVILQSQELTSGKIQTWDGTSWKVVDAKIDGGKATFEIEKLGVIVLTE
ncbi:hypothetical protein GYA49_03300 [Candidatus Beckwithbacteria bacterium]|nr:hypothetical protein [Candidatus Beckwithbacteria bacterium]